MTTLVLGPRPPELQALIDKRRELGLDGHDEVWDGVYVMAPFAAGGHGRLKSQLVRHIDVRAEAAGLTPGDSFNLGEANDFRVPDAGYHWTFRQRVYYDTAAIVLEVLSPDEDPESKLSFYAAHHVQEVLVADPRGHTLRCWQLRDGALIETDRSALLDVAMATLTAQVDWP